MDLRLSDEQQLIVDSAAAFLAEHSAMPAVRAVCDGGAGLDRSLWEGLAALGWCGVHLPEAQGGLGLGLVELVLLQEQLGRHLACVPFFDSVALAATCLRELAEASHWPPLLASGAVIAGLALPAEGQVLPVATPAATGWRLDGRWPLVGSGAQATLLLLPARGPAGELLLFAVETETETAARQGPAGLRVQALSTLDATRGAAHVHADGLCLAAAACIARGPALLGALERTRCLAAIALAAEQVGVAEQCLQLTLAYTAGRIQFDRPVAAFQAVKHRCAEMAVKLEGARSAVYSAACMADTGLDAAALLFHAAQARVEATAAANFCAQEAIQLHGGVGYTWEYDPHLYLRRAQAASQRLGPVGQWLEAVAAQLLDGEEVLA